VSDIDRINNGTIMVNGKEEPALKLEMIPGPDSDQSQLSLTSKVILSTSKQLLVQLTFENAGAIS